MRLVSVYEVKNAPEVLWDLLHEREPHVNISHKVMPTWQEHLNFIASVPYAAWYLIEVEGRFVGAIYLTHAREVGIFIFKIERGHGYGSKALDLLAEKHPGKLLANIAPCNEESMAWFMKRGFMPLQFTYCREETPHARSIH